MVFALYRGVLGCGTFLNTQESNAARLTAKYQINITDPPNSGERSKVEIKDRPSPATTQKPTTPPWQHWKIALPHLIEIIQMVVFILHIDIHCTL